MGVEYSFKDEEGPQVMRCPKCEVISVVKAGEKDSGLGFYAGLSGEYFICQNPGCEVERIYGSNCVVTSK